MSSGMSSLLRTRASLRSFHPAPSCPSRPYPLPLPILRATTFPHKRLTHTSPTASTDDAFAHALSSNKSWCSATASSKPDLFPTLAKGQAPQILWLGCSDSRCPETTLLGLQPGDVFVHRNIANVFTPTDLSVQAVLAFAVGALKVKHVVVCGHTKCGGVAAALGGDSKGGVLDTWLAPLRRLRAELATTWEKEGTDEGERARMMIEGNVREGVRTVRENTVVLDAVKSGALQVHGAVYDVGSGELKEIGIEEKEEDKGRREGVFGLK